VHIAAAFYRRIIWCYRKRLTRVEAKLALFEQYRYQENARIESGMIFPNELQRR